MKLFVLAAVALAGLTPALAAPAIAQHSVVTQRTMVHRGPMRASRTHKVCSTSYRHHHRVRTCRVVRTR